MKSLFLKSFPRVADLLGGLRGYHMFKAWRAGKIFYCRALQGESVYNICINSDMSVSCNCRDYDGSGLIGNLERQTLDEIFRGSAASNLRRALASGRLPLANCASCSDLQTAPKTQAEKFLREFHPPTRGIMVENTSRCNLRCLYCARDTLAATRAGSGMSLEQIGRVADTIAEHGIESVAFHNLGEPFMTPSVDEEARIIRERNPGAFLLTSTNGMLLSSDRKREAALMFDMIYFSLDGPNQQTASIYQVGIRFDRSYENMKRLVEMRNRRGLEKPWIEWKYVVFRWNDLEDHINQAVALAREANVDAISFWPGGGAISARSLRFRTSPFFKTLGEQSWKGREIIFRQG